MVVLVLVLTFLFFDFGRYLMSYALRMVREGGSWALSMLTAF